MMTMDRVIKAQEFRDIRSRSRLTNRQLAKTLGVSVSTISNWLRDGVVGHAEADVEEKLGIYMRQESPDRPLRVYTDVELLAELWQRMDEYKRQQDGRNPGMPPHIADFTGRIGERPRRGDSSDDELGGHPKG